MNDNALHSNETCPCCPRGCSLSAPSCGRGREYAERLAAGEPPAAEQAHGGHHHGHGHGPHGGSMPAPDSLEGLLLRCGHALHHGGHGQKDLFAGLTQQEQDALRGLLQKLVGSLQES